jgi:hypothetical protein
MAGGGGARRSVLLVNEPKKTNAAAPGRVARTEFTIGY